jgi:putative ABC transport system permease protein
VISLIPQRSAIRTTAMARLSLSETRRRPGRVVVTMVMVALGSGALSLALVLGASVQKAVNNGLQVEYTAYNVIQQSDLATANNAEGTGQISTAIGPADLHRIAKLPSVQSIGSIISTTAVARVGTLNRGIGLETLNTNPHFIWQRWSAGHAPDGANQIGLSQYTLKDLGIRLGDEVALGTPSAGTALYRVVGVVNTRGAMDWVTSDYGIVSTPVAEQLAGIDGPNTVMVKAKPGAKISSIINGINRVAPVGVPVTTNSIVAGNRSVQLAEVNALSAVVAVLAALSILVAAIASATTTGASLATRRRTWALIRCIGADKRQVAGLVTVESIAMGLIGSVIGVACGVGLARLALPLLSLVPGLPPIGGSAFTVGLDAILLPLILALVLALLGALVPAFLASRIPPSAALKATSSTRASSFSRVRLIGVSLVAIAGLVVAYEAAGHRAPLLAVLGVLALIGATGGLLTPALVWIAQRCAHYDPAIDRRLGFLDVVRRPRTAAIEAVAVMLAVGMISLSYVALSSISAATAGRLSRSPLPDLTIGAVSGSAPIAAGTLTQLAAVKGVAAVAAVKFGSNITLAGRGKDGKVTVAVGTATGDPRTFSRALPQRFPVRHAEPGVVYLPVTAFPPFYAGSKVSMTGPNGVVRHLTVAYVKGLQVPSFVNPRTLAKVSQSTTTQLAWIALKPGINRGQVVGEITGDAILGGELPVSGPAVLAIRAASALAAARAAAVAILAIAVLVAVIGAAATAALSISDRAHEHATLRALGLARRDLGRMLATRVLFVSLVAAVLGVLVGGILGIVASRLVIVGLSLEPKMSFPLLPIGIVVVITVLAVRLAALVPMERASYIPASRALARG